MATGATNANPRNASHSSQVSDLSSSRTLSGQTNLTPTARAELIPARISRWTLDRDERRYLCSGRAKNLSITEYLP